MTRFASAISNLGIDVDECVSLFLKNSAEFAVAAYGTARAGAVMNPVNYRLAPADVIYILGDCDSKLLLFEEDTRETIEHCLDDLETVEHFIYIDDDVTDTPEYAIGFHSLLDSASAEPPAVELNSEDQYIVVYTSGTTGRPKGVVHTHEDATYHNMLYNGRKGIDFREIGISVMPMYHVAELNCGLFARANLGAKSVILHEFNAQRVLEMIDKEQVTYLFVASRTWSELLQVAEQTDFDGSSLALGVYGAAPMPPSLLEQCMDVFTDTFATAYGMTEMGPNATFLLPFEVKENLGSVGRAAPNHEVRIVQPTESETPEDMVSPDDTLDVGTIGEIILQGPPMMNRYWKLPKETESAIRDGWFFTGDAGYLDEEGYLYLVDRIDDMIISGGENVYPTEVENVLYQHKSVAEVAVIGEETDEWGETIVAYIVLNDETTEESLDAFCKQSTELADFKRPRAYYFRDELPKNPSGKIQKFKLRDE